MFMLVGIVAMASLILGTLYFFIFRRFHTFINAIVLILVSIGLILTKFLHGILLGITVLTAGAFIVYFNNRRQPAAQRGQRNNHQ